MLKLHTVGFWFSRPSIVPGWSLPKLGWKCCHLLFEHLDWDFTHVGLRLNDAVYDVRLDRPSEWIAETDYRKVCPDLLCLDFQLLLDIDEVCEMLPTGVPFQLLPSVIEYLDRPSFAPQAWNCLAASRKVLEYLGRPSDAVTPDQLYTEVLDFQRSLRGDLQARPQC